jgi:hypothetical protein
MCLRRRLICLRCHCLNANNLLPCQLAGNMVKTPVTMTLNLMARLKTPPSGHRQNAAMVPRSTVMRHYSPNRLPVTTITLTLIDHPIALTEFPTG